MCRSFRTLRTLSNAAGSQENFFAAMSHELRTPLVGIIGLADGIVAGRPAPDERHSLNFARFFASRQVAREIDLPAWR